MLRRNRIPEKDTEFNQYIYRTTAALLNGTPPTWRRLGLSEEEKNKWVGFMNRWDELYPKYTDLTKRTSVITAEKNSTRIEFIKSASPLLRRMAAHNPTQADRAAFNLRAKKHPYTRRGKIEDIPSAHIETLGSGRLRFRVRRENQEGRRGKHPLADVLEIRYCLSAERKTHVALAECTETNYKTKTYFTLQLPEETAGKWGYFYLRWSNLRKEENSGPFSNMLMGFVT